MAAYGSDSEPEIEYEDKAFAVGPWTLTARVIAELPLDVLFDLESKRDALT